MACAANSLDIDVFAADADADGGGGGGGGSGRGSGSYHQSTQGFAGIRDDDHSDSRGEMQVQGDEPGEGEREGEEERQPGGDVMMGGVSAEEGGGEGRTRSFSVDSTTPRAVASLGGPGGAGGTVSVDAPPGPPKSHSLTRLHGQGLLAAPPRLLGRVVGLLRRWGIH